MKRAWLVHPFLVALAPVCFLLSHNVAEAAVTDALVPAAVALGVGLVLLVGARPVVRSWQKAGLLASVCLILLFSYGHIAAMLDGWAVAGVLIGRPLTYLLVDAIVVVVAAVALIRTRRDLKGFGQFLVVAAACFVAISLVRIGAYEFGQRPRGYAPEAENELLAGLQLLPREARRPSIYYIVVDAYARHDVLEELYGYDNTAFLDSLRAKGFYVAAESRSNYAYTCFSFASSLNASHLHELAEQIGEDARGYQPLQQMIRESQVIAGLRSQGYRLVAMPSGYGLTEMPWADLYLRRVRSLTEFELALLNTTPVPVILDFVSGGRKQASGYEQHRRCILHVFDCLRDAPKLPGPTFVFAHVIAPHQPFVFDEDGNRVTPTGPFTLAMSVKERSDPALYREAYTRQLAFINAKLEECIDTILATSEQPPIIIVQSDHGAGMTLHANWPRRTNMKERLSILNAYYFPDGDYSLLYDGITPVNTFRVIFNKFFGAELELLDDESYFSTLRRPFKFRNVTGPATSDGLYVPDE